MFYTPRSCGATQVLANIRMGGIRLYFRYSHATSVFRYYHTKKICQEKNKNPRCYKPAGGQVLSILHQCDYRAIDQGFVLDIFARIHVETGRTNIIHRNRFQFIVKKN